MEGGKVDVFDTIKDPLLTLPIDPSYICCIKCDMLACSEILKVRFKKMITAVIRKHYY